MISHWFNYSFSSTTNYPSNILFSLFIESLLDLKIPFLKCCGCFFCQSANLVNLETILSVWLDAQLCFSVVSTWSALAVCFCLSLYQFLLLKTETHMICFQLKSRLSFISSTPSFFLAASCSFPSSQFLFYFYFLIGCDSSRFLQLSICPYWLETVFFLLLVNILLKLLLFLFILFIH